MFELFQDSDIKVSVSGIVLISVLTLLILAALCFLTTRSGKPRLCKKKQIRVAEVLAASP
jgi:hypothetical protein